jgi:hypothetical protein
MTKTKKNVSRISKKKYNLKNKTISKKSKITTKSKKSKTPKTNFTSRIIIKDNIGGIVADKDTIKEILESIGSKVEVVIYNDIKNDARYFTKDRFKKVNIQIFIEHVMIEYPLEIFPADKSFIFVNQEYVKDWDIDRMLDETKSQSIIPLCKTQESLKTLHKLGITNAKYVGFGNNKKFKYIDGNDGISKIDKIPNLFIHIVGSSPLKGSRTLIDTWINKNIKETLIITANNKSGGNTNLFKYWKSLKPKVKQLPESLLHKWEEWLKITNNKDTKLPQFETIYSGCSIYFCGSVLDYNVIQFLQSVAEVHMCPSLIEGWGQYIDEGRRTKSVVLTLDAPPMNELVKNGETGILVNATPGPKMKHLLPDNWTQYFTKNTDYNKFLYGTYKTSQNDLYNSINRILNMSLESKRKLGENAFIQSQKDYNNFKTNFSKVVLDSNSNSNSNSNTNKIDNETKRNIIVSYFNDNSNIYHIFACEIMAIWNKSKGNLDTIIVLKNYVNNNINNWRLSLLKSIYKDVYIHNLPSSKNFKDLNKNFIIKEILNTKYYKFLNESFKFIKQPKSQNYINMANTIKANVQMKNNIKGNTVAFIYRTKNRILYDYKTKELIQNILIKELKKSNISFKSANFDNSTFEEQAEFLKDVKILIACHGAAFTNLVLLPQNATIMEVSFRKYWYCSPICDGHLSGKYDYKEDCHTISNSRYYDKKNKKLIYHKADYYNLSQLFGIGYKEILIEDANGYFKNPGDKDYNPINLTNIYIDTNTMIDKIKTFY